MTQDMMQYTLRVEAEMKQKATYQALFKKENLRRTEIVFWVYTSQQMCAQLMSYFVYFLQEAGLSTALSFELAMGQYALGTVGVIVSWFLVPRWGRRTFLLVGLAYCAVTTFVVGFLGLGDTPEHPALANAVGALLLIQYGVFFATITPITYTIVSEVPSNVLRTKSVALGRCGYNAITIIYGQLIPRMIQRSSWNWGARCGLLWGFVMVVMFVWAFFRVPVKGTPKNRELLHVLIIWPGNQESDICRGRHTVQERTWRSQIQEGTSRHCQRDGEYIIWMSVVGRPGI